ISATCLEVPDAALRTRVDLDEGDRRLVFQFPDTDALLPPDGDDQTLTGPVAIAVTRAVRGAKTAPAPCGLVSGTCANQSNVLACVDSLYENDGACGTAVPNAEFPGFTALPPPNDYQADCFRSDPPCTAAASEVRAAVDSIGNVLIPMGWGGVLV